MRVAFPNLGCISNVNHPKDNEMGFLGWGIGGARFSSEEEDQDDGHRECEHCGEDVSRQDYFDNIDCPACGKPCSEPF